MLLFSIRVSEWTPVQEKSYSFDLFCVFIVKVYQFVHVLLISRLVFRIGSRIWLSKFLITAYLFFFAVQSVTWVWFRLYCMRKYLHLNNNIVFYFLSNPKNGIFQLAGWLLYVNTEWRVDKKQAVTKLNLTHTTLIIYM